jgi:hypothetical protein
MSPETQDLIRAEQLRDVRFIIDIIQGGRIRPSVYIHEFEMPLDIYLDMKNAGVIDHEYLFLQKLAFFEFRKEKVIVSFHHIYNREDFRSMADRFLIIQAYGSYPFKANWTSKINFDEKVEAAHSKNHECKNQLGRSIV